jgi:hypothetical protein
MTTKSNGVQFQPTPSTPPSRIVKTKGIRSRSATITAHRISLFVRFCIKINFMFLRIFPKIFHFPNWNIVPPFLISTDVSRTSRDGHEGDEGIKSLLIEPTKNTVIERKNKK